MDRVERIRTDLRKARSRYPESDILDDVEYLLCEVDRLRTRGGALGQIAQHRLMLRKAVADSERAREEG